MKVLVLSSLAFSLLNFRGALLAELRKQGHEVLAVAPDYDRAVEAGLKAMGIELRVVPMHRTGTNPFKDLQTLFAYWRLMRKERPDVIVAYTQKPIIYGGIAARLYGKAPFHALMSGLGHLFSEDAQDRVVVRGIFSRLYRAALKKAVTLFVFNRDDRPDMIAAGIIDERHRVLQVPGSGVDTQHYVEAPLRDGAPVFLMMGRLMRDKGVYDYLEAARIVQRQYGDVRFQLLGRPEDSNRTGISEAEVHRLSSEYPVEFLAETRDVRPYLAQCSVFVLPSFYREGLPRTILEAMSSGRAVITTDMPGCRDPIEHEGNGLLVPAKSPQDLAKAMIRLVEDPEMLRKMSRRSREIAEQTYDVKIVNHMLLDAMDLIAHDGPMQRAQSQTIPYAA
ncbi:glycosyltransferase family 4 protein [Novosphingobium sp.]|uniref:glycosyltransferase family 4 protein n=1 Tax=Novosphingobium sp. TaxID=1874826 RepID=UPI003568911E